MRRPLFLFMMLAWINAFPCLFSQSRGLVPRAFLEKEVSESSGLLFVDGTLWTFNDSGGDPVLYAIDTSDGKIVRHVVIGNARNEDWEAIACDRRYVYIGDVGNNKGHRRILSIYRISRAQLQIPSLKEIKAETISFEYRKKQKRKQSGEKKEKNSNFYSSYDCEAMFCVSDTLYLLSKNWMNDDLTFVYAIPAVPGHYCISPVGTVETDGLVCDAALRPSDSGVLAITGYKDFMPFVSFYRVESLHPLRLHKTGGKTFVKYNGLQTEGITFIDDHRLMISCEGNKFFPARLYRLEK